MASCYPLADRASQAGWLHYRAYLAKAKTAFRAGKIMPVFSREGLNILYLHVPKTGGTSIEKFFQNNGFAITYLDSDIRPMSLSVVRRCSPQHMHRDQLESIFNVGSFQYVFMTVRDPYARIVSEYKMQATVFSKEIIFDDWLKRALKLYAVNKFVYDNHLRPQSDYWLPQADVFKQEYGYTSQWITEIEKKIGIGFSHHKIATEMKGSDVVEKQPILSPEARSYIGRLYSQDFSMFGYSI
jgi:hypothetical protein